MGRIDEKELDSLKKDSDLVGLVRSHGVNLKATGSSGKDFIGHCPFHEDKTPSFVVTPSKGLYHCFGCGAAGSSIDFLMKTRNVSFLHAVELLRDQVGGDPLSYGRRSDDETSLKSKTQLKNPLHTTGTDQDLLNSVIDYYHSRLTLDAEALSYLSGRGLGDLDLIKKYKLGYSDRSLGLRLPDKKTRVGRELRERLQKIGILRESGHEHLRGSVVIPVLGQNGDVLTLYGRKTRDDLKADIPRHLYLSGPRLGIFNKVHLESCDEVILCESLIDALSFISVGIFNVTTSYGVSGPSEELFSFLSSGQFRRVYIAYDNDKAGKQAANSLAAKFNKSAVEVRFFEQPYNQDVNGYLQQIAANQPAKEKAAAEIKAQFLKGLNRSETLGDELYPPFLGFSESKALPQVVSQAASSLAAKKAAPVLAASTSKTSGNSIEEKVGDAYLFRFGEKTYRVLGLEKNEALDIMKVNLKITLDGLFYLDTLDLFMARARASYIKGASFELGIGEDELKKDLTRLIARLEQILLTLDNGGSSGDLHSEAIKNKALNSLTEAEKTQSLELLKNPKLLDVLLNDLEELGMVGELHNKLATFFCFISRGLERPLGLVIQSSSAAGKSSLLDGVLKLIPKEDVIRFSSLSGQSLYYMGAENSLKHKILCIAEEEGMGRASYALKLLQSDGELTMASTGKDDKTGKLVTREYHTEGPAQISLTTTGVDMDPELANRCLVLSVDESSHQTKEIQKLQRFYKTREGQKRRFLAASIINKWQNALRLIRQIPVSNPLAPELDFSSDHPRRRRDQMKYLSLMEAVALLFQYQKPIQKDEYGEFIEVDFRDVEIADFVARFALGRTMDELPPQTRNLMGIIFCLKELPENSELGEDFRFKRKDLRSFCKWGDTQLKVHLSRLVEFEFLSFEKRDRAFFYKVEYKKADAGLPFVRGLVDMQRLREKYGYDFDRSAFLNEQSGHGRPMVGLKNSSTNGLNTSLEEDLETGRGKSENSYRNTEKTSEIMTILEESPLSVNGVSSHARA